MEREIAKRRGKSTLFLPINAPRILRCIGPNGEALTIEYAQLQTGTIVDEYHLWIAGKTIDIPAVRGQLAAKYGKPTVGDLMNGAWCDPGYRCGAAFALTEGPVVMVETRVDVSIVATRGGSAHKADEAAVVSAADKVAPKNSKAAF